MRTPLSGGYNNGNGNDDDANSSINTTTSTTTNNGINNNNNSLQHVRTRIFPEESTSELSKWTRSIIGSCTWIAAADGQWNGSGTASSAAPCLRNPIQCTSPTPSRSPLGVNGE